MDLEDEPGVVVEAAQLGEVEAEAVGEPQPVEERGEFLEPFDGLSGPRRQLERRLGSTLEWEVSTLFINAVRRP